MEHYGINRGKNEGIERSHKPDVVLGELGRLGRPVNKNNPNQVMNTLADEEQTILVFTLPAPTYRMFVSTLYNLPGVNQFASNLKIYCLRSSLSKPYFKPF